ncbi:hypothetical protein HY449_01415 [Candidatus Pacearchaeota archaeon]|nr:hypothetical protein [Candidatus Pacearchaeota archaeon]
MTHYTDENFRDVYKSGRFRFKTRRAPRIPDYMRGTSLKGLTTIYPAPVPEQISKRKRLTEYYKNSKLSRQKHSARLERILGTIVSAEALVFSLFLLSGNFTGMAISNLTRSDANISGAALFVIGVVGILIILKRK